MQFLFLLGLEGGKYISTCEKVDERRHLTSGVRKKARNERVKTTKSGSDPLVGAFCTRNLDRLLLSSLTVPPSVANGLNSNMIVGPGGNTNTYARFRSHHGIYNSTFISLQTSSVFACNHVDSLRSFCIIVHLGNTMLACRVGKSNLDKGRILDILFVT